MSEKKIKLTSIKLALLGDSRVGKTAICKVLKDNKFDGNDISTIGFDKIDKKVKLENGSVIKVVIYDTTGQERFRSSAIQTVRAVHGLIIVFDLTNKSTFENVDNWLEVIKDNFDQPSMILLGNKSDYPEKEWQVTPEEIKMTAEKYKLKYFETSAKTKKNIHEGFNYIVNSAYSKLKESKNVIIDLNDDTKKKSGGCFGKKKK